MAAAQTEQGWPELTRGAVRPGEAGGQLGCAEDAGRRSQNCRQPWEDLGPDRPKGSQHCQESWCKMQEAGGGNADQEAQMGCIPTASEGSLLEAACPVRRGYLELRGRTGAGPKKRRRLRTRISRTLRSGKLAETRRSPITSMLLRRRQPRQPWKERARRHWPCKPKLHQTNPETLRT